MREGIDFRSGLDIHPTHSIERERACVRLRFRRPRLPSPLAAAWEPGNISLSLLFLWATTSRDYCLNNPELVLLNNRRETSSVDFISMGKKKHRRWQNCKNKQVFPGLRWAGNAGW